jgi:hypothetical protein
MGFGVGEGLFHLREVQVRGGGHGRKWIKKTDNKNGICFIMEAFYL